MLDSLSELLPFDPEIERTLRRKLREKRDLQVNIVQGDPKVLLRHLWIPINQGSSSKVVEPAIQANNFELKPALINMVQQSRFGGSAVEDPHEHITTFLEYCNTLKCNGVTQMLSDCPYSLSL